MFLIIVAIMSITNALRLQHVTPNQPFHPAVPVVFALTIWSFITWRIWKRPRQWGLGVGIFLLVVFAFQSYLWYLAGFNPQPEKLGMAYTTSNFILYEAPLVVAAICCILLRWHYPNHEQPSIDTQRA